MIIPFEKLAPETLANLIEEFVTREGTDSGYVKGDLPADVARIRRQLERKLAVIVYDEKTESCNIVPVDFLKGKIEK